ncbi:TPA: macrolide transporter subunit MacA [Proteus mirabilis]|nr:macrolide transporter subunit MacA [Proteus mirabilis]HEJ9666352.1 macrolide transporter subunit MacA [Proteus mirabilis]HEK2152559.1 macrolide transporter subunit MacA [Proteus mirabilis]HEK2595399.1 macrolide transporter subunit MacA [Proteus mirabilis]HEK2891789.1 macrolide transporter subunit MacA [Proteus mirabilis]
MAFFLTKKQGKIIAAILIFIAIGLFFFWPKEHLVSYQTQKITRGELSKEVTATGKLDAVRKVDVGAQVSGQLQTLYVKEGDVVKKGDLLAIIDPKKAQNEVAESQETNNELTANLQQAKAELRLAQLTYQRQLKLIGTHVIAQEELDRTKTDVEVKKARVATYEAQIRKNQATLDTARTNLQYTRITAPMDGVVTFIKTLEGQTVIAAQEAPTILTLADLDTMLVKAEVSEADVIYLKPDLKASFTVLGAPDKAFNGKLKDILPTPEKINDAIFYYARFEVPNEQHLLRLQMTAQVKILLEHKKDILLVPLSALGEDVGINEYQVEVLVNGQPEKRVVKIGIRTDVYAEVISGLNENDDVILGEIAGES